MKYIKQGFLATGVVFAGLSMMTACSVIKGTVTGAEQVVSAPVKAVDKALTPAEKKKAVHKKKKVYKKTQQTKVSKKTAKKMHSKPTKPNAVDVTIGS